MNNNRFTLRAAVYLVLLKDNQVLMAQRAGSGYHDGDYSLVAGHVDGGEPATHAMCREAKEEIDIAVLPENLTLVHVMHRKMENETIEYIDFFFSPTEWSGDPSIKEPHKCSDLKWFPLNRLPQNIVPEIQRVLDLIDENIVFSEHFDL